MEPPTLLSRVCILKHVRAKGADAYNFERHLTEDGLRMDRCAKARITKVVCSIWMVDI